MEMSESNRRCPVMKKWIIRTGLFIAAMAVISYVFVDRELNKMYGGLTQVADLTLTADSVTKYALTHVNVLTHSADNFLPNHTVVIDNGIIVAVGTDVELDVDTPVINGEGRYLVPGFTDSHVHLWQSENDLLLYLANGVTQIREMNGSDTHLQLKKEIQAGRVGPDMFVVAPQLATFEFVKGLFVKWTQRKTIVRTNSQVDKAVKGFKDAGYDAIKASSFLDKEGYIAISAATKKYAIPLVGHIPLAVGFDEMWNSNQSEIAHVEEVAKALNREFGGYTYANADEYLDFVRRRSDNVAEHLLQAGIVVTSTLELIDSFEKQKADLEGELKRVELQYANPGITEGVVITSHGMGWMPGVNIYRWPEDWDAQRREKSLVYWQTYAQAQHIVFDALLQKGVPIMAGTDANVPITVPGFSLHDEMKALSNAGMTPAQVLAAATSAPARWKAMPVGQISPGFKANLVLLRSNPLSDINATKSIDKVIKNGHVFSRSDLDAMLASVKDANDKSRTVDVVAQ